MATYYSSCGWLPFGWSAKEISIEDIMSAPVASNPLLAPSKPDVCCKALTAECLACGAGVSVEEYCSLESNKDKAGCKIDLCSNTVCPQDVCADGSGRREIDGDCCACP